MTYRKEYKNIRQYEHVSTNQYGYRYKQTGTKTLLVAELSAKIDNATDLKRLILLSHFLEVPVHYDFETHVAWIKIMSAESVNNAI